MTQLIATITSKETNIPNDNSKKEVKITYSLIIKKDGNEIANAGANSNTPEDVTAVLTFTSKEDDPGEYGPEMDVFNEKGRLVGKITRGRLFIGNNGNVQKAPPKNFSKDSPTGLSNWGGNLFDNNFF